MSQGRSLGRLWRRRSIWQVRIRWAVPPAICLCVGAGLGFGFEFPWLPLLVIAGVILAYNAGLALAFNMIRVDEVRCAYLDRLLAVIQVSLDYGALFGLVYFTGGLASPLLFFFAFHVIFAAILFRPSTAYLFAAAATAGVALLTVGAFTAGIPHHSIWFEGQELAFVERRGHAVVTLASFSAAMFITAGVSNMIMGRLRERVMALAEATERVASLNDKLSSLYVMVETVSAEKELDRIVAIVAEELTKATEVAGITVKLLSEDGKTLRYVAVHGLPAEFRRDRVIELDRSPFNRRVLEGETLVLGSVAEHLGFQLRDDLMAAGIQSVILAPLTVEQRVLGVLGAYRREADQFSDEDSNFFRLAAELVAIGIDNARQNEAIRRLMEARIRIMLQVAHNLRAPLSAATTMLDTIGGEYLGAVTNKQREYLGRIERRLRAMRATVDELLVLANARSLDLTAEREPVALGPVVTEVESSFRPEAERKGVQLSATVEPELPELLGSASLLQQLVENLVSNSIKYTPEGGSIRMELRGLEDGAWLRLEVSDTGIGIPEAEQSRLFTEFFRATNARKLDELGTGLGLSIVKQIVAGHGGQLDIESAEGRGTRVRVDLPAGSQVGPASAPPRSTRCAPSTPAGERRPA